MIREILLPENKQAWLELRKQDITSTDCAAMFGLSPYKTPLAVWLKLHEGFDEAIEETERMKWGSRLEAAIANGIAEDKGWSIEAMKSYHRIKDLRLGSSFDFFIPSEKAILEIKNVGLHQFKDWVETASGIEAPLHIEMQVQHQMLVAGCEHAYIGVLVGGNQVHVMHRTADIEVQEQIIAKSKEMLTGPRPSPDYAKDHEIIMRLNNFAEPGSVAEASHVIDQLVYEYKKLGDQIKTLETAQDIAKARIVEFVGPVEKVKGQGYSISMNMVSPATVSYERKGYRQFIINFPRGDKQ